MKLVKLFSLRGLVCCKPAYNRCFTPPYGQVIFPYAKAVAPLRRVGPARARRGRRPAGRLRAGASVSDASVARNPDRLPAQDPAADRLGRGRPPGRIRRGAASCSQHRRGPGCHETGHSGRRGRALLFARGRRLSQRAAGRGVEPRVRYAAGRRHHHDAGRPQLLPDAGEDDHTQAAGGAARLEDRGQPVQGRDPPALRQPDLPRTAGLRLRRRRPDLFRKVAEGRHAGRGRDARGIAQSAVGLQPGHQPQTCENPAIVCAEANARPEVHH